MIITSGPMKGLAKRTTEIMSKAGEKRKEIKQPARLKLSLFLIKFWHRLKKNSYSRLAAVMHYPNRRRAVFPAHVLYLSVSLPP